MMIDRNIILNIYCVKDFDTLKPAFLSDEDKTKNRHEILCKLNSEPTLPGELAILQSALLWLECEKEIDMEQFSDNKNRMLEYKDLHNRCKKIVNIMLPGK